MQCLSLKGKIIRAADIYRALIISQALFYVLIYIFSTTLETKVTQVSSFTEKIRKLRQEKVKLGRRTARSQSQGACS